MCGRLALFTSPDCLSRLFDAELDSEVALGPRYNVGPTSTVLGLVPAVRRPGRGRPGANQPRLVLRDYRWGLVPPWATEIPVGNRLCNARAESVAEKPSFRDAFRHTRVAIVADGFFEWRRTGTARQPYYFARRDGRPMAFAGLHTCWRDPAYGRGAPPLRTCTIITTAAGPDMTGIHDRMPVVLEDDERAIWLEPGNDDRAELRSLLRPGRDGILAHYPVDRRVGSVRNDDPAVIQPLPDPGPAQLHPRGAVTPRHVSQQALLPLGFG